MTPANLRILYEDNHLLVVVKPAGLLVQGDRTGDATLLELCREDLKARYGKPGNVFLGLVHRLDRPVSGVVALARTSKAAGRLSEQFRRGEVRKTYLAVVAGEPAADAAELRHHLAASADASGRTRCDERPFAGSREATLAYRLLESRGGLSLLEVRPRTGRRHQIRVQLAAIGLPLVGDLKYGASAALPDRSVALHAWRLALRHPVGGRELEFVAPPPAGPPWRDFAAPAEDGSRKEPA